MICISMANADKLLTKVSNIFILKKIFIKNTKDKYNELSRN